MTAYQVRHRYASSRDGRRFGPWAEGDVVELEAPDAEWVERDSPGALGRVDEQPVDDRPALTPEVEAEAYALHEQRTPTTAPAAEPEATPAAAPRRRRGGAA